MSKKKLSTILFAAASVVLVVVLFFPIWRITLTAPQYPEGVTMYIWVNGITGATKSTLQNVNILNHYVGMKEIKPGSIPEFRYFPYILGAMALLGLVAAFLKKGWLKLSWVIVLAALGILGIYDFYMWEYDYGHNLSPDAPIKIPGQSYQPPLFGEKKILNFNAESYPHTGSLFLGLSMTLAAISFIIQQKSRKNDEAKNYDQSNGSNGSDNYGNDRHVVLSEERTH